MSKVSRFARILVVLVVFVGAVAANLLPATPALAVSDRYWVGDSGAWSQTSHWSTSSGGASGASVPTSANDVHFDAASCADGSFTVTLSGTMSARDLDFASLDDTLIFSDGGSGTAWTLNVYNNLISSTFLTWTGIDNHNEWVVMKTNGTTITGATNPTWSSQGAGVEIQATVTQVNDFYCNDFKATSGSYTLADTLYVGGAFTGAGWTYGGEVQLIGTGRTSALAVTGLNTFNDLNIATTGLNNYVTFNADQTITGTLTAVGTSSRNCVTLMSDGSSQRTLTAATVVTDHTNWAYIIGAGAGDWDLAAEDSMEISNTTAGITLTYDRSVTVTQDMYWYGCGDGVPGGGGSWSVSDTSIALMYNWSTTSGDSGGSGRMPRPSTTNFVYFDANSGFTGGDATVSWSLAQDGGYTYCGGMDWTGADSVTGPIFSNGSGNYYPLFGVYGDVIFCAGLTFSNWNEDAFVFLGTGGTYDFVTNNAYTNIRYIINAGAGGTYTVDGDIIGLVRFVNTSGTFDTITNSSSFIYDVSQNYPSFDGRLGQTYYRIEWTPDNSAVRQFSFLSSCTVQNLYVQGNAQYDHQLKFGADMYFTNFFIHGYSGIYRLELKSTSAGTQRQCSISGSVDVVNVDISDSAKVGAGDPDISGGNNSDFGGNLGWIFDTGYYIYWVGNNGYWSDLTNHWASTSGGTPGTGRVPLIQDVAVFDQNSFTIPGRVVTIDITDISGIDASAALNTPTFTKAGTIDIYGDVNLGTCIYTVTTTNFKGLDTTFESDSVLTTNMYVLKNDGFMSSLYLNGNLDLDGNLYVTSGVFNHNNFNVTAYTYDSSTTTYTRQIILGNGATTLDGTAAGNKWNINATNLTFTPNESTIILTNSGANGQTFAGAGRTYNNVTQAGAGAWTMTVSGTNTIGTLTIDRSLANKTISGAVTITLTDPGGLIMDLGGTRTITITNTDFTMASGVVFGDYLIISGSAAAGGATFFANVGGHSTDNGGNSGWIWTPPTPPTVTTLDATDVTYLGERLNGQLTTAGSYVVFYAYFEYGPTVAYGFTTPETTLNAPAPKNFNQYLSPYKVYHYRAVVRFGLNDHAYGNDKTVSITGGVGQAKAAVSDPGQGSGVALVSSVPAVPGNMYNEGSTSGIPIAPLIDPALAESNTPVEAFWYPIAFVIALLLGFAAFGLTKSILVQAIVSAVIMAAFCGGGVLGSGLLPYWTVLVFVIEAGMIWLIQEKQHV